MPHRRPGLASRRFVIGHSRIDRVGGSELAARRLRSRIVRSNEPLGWPHSLLLQLRRREPAVTLSEEIADAQLLVGITLTRSSNPKEVRGHDFIPQPGW